VSDYDKSLHSVPPPKVNPALLVTEPYRQRDTLSFVAKTGESTTEIAYNPLYTLSQVAAALTVGGIENFPPTRVDSVPPVTEPYRALVHAGYGEEDSEIVQLTTRMDNRNLAYTQVPMQFAFPGMHEPRPSVRFDLPYTACDKVTPRPFVRPPTPFYARDTVTREVPATSTLPTTAVSVCTLKRTHTY